MSQLASNAKWLAAAQVARIVIQLISMTVLARLLEPRYYGLMAIASVITSFAWLFKDMGSSAAIIQAPTLTDKTKSAVFWMNIGMGVLICIALCSSSLFVANYFKEAELRWVVVAVSLSFPISALSAVSQALLERESAFRFLTIVEFTAQLSGLIVAIGAALYGLGVFSLVAQALTISVFTTLIIVFRRPWWPKERLDFGALREIFSFSSSLTGFNLVNFFSRNSDSIVLGKIVGAAPLGGYNLAYKLMLFPLQSITHVSSRALFPVLSRQQDDKSRMLETYLSTVAFVSLLTFPVMAGLWAVREVFVLVIFGEKWGSVPDIIAWLAPVGVVQSVVSTTGTVFMAAGRTNILFWLGIFSAVTQVAAFLVGATWNGIEGVVRLYLFANIINAVPNIVFTMKVFGRSAFPFLRVLMPASLSALIMACILRYQPFTSSLPSIVELAVLVCGGGLCYIGALFFLFRNSFLQVAERIRSRRGA